MINKQMRRWFGSNIFKFVGTGGMMGASNFTGSPNSPVFASAGAFRSYFSTVIDDAPELYLRFNETTGSTAADSMNNHTATYESGVVKGADTLIVADLEYAAHFDGVNDHVAVASAPYLGNEFTLECWCVCSASTPNAGIMSEQLSSAASPIAYSMGINQTTGGGGVDTHLHGGFWTGVGAWKAATYEEPLPLAQTLHLLTTKDSGNIRLYMNAIEVGSTAVTASVITDGDWFHVGQRHDTGAAYDFFDGTIDEVAIYASALTLAKIRDHYAIGKGYGPNSYAYHVINDGARGYWPFNSSTAISDVNDPDITAGTINAGVSTGAITSVAESSACFDFDGTANAYVPVGEPATLQIVSALTLEAWVQTTYAGGNTKAIMGRDNVGSSLRNFDLDLNGSYIPRFSIFKSNVGYSVVGASTVNDGKWHHIVGRNDGTNITMTVNGVVASTSANGGTMDNDTAGFEIGRYAYAPTPAFYCFDGKIDQPAIYATAITDEAVRRHYAIGMGFIPDTYAHRVIVDGAEHFWRFNETSGTTNYSETGIRLRGTHTGAPVLQSAAIFSALESSVWFDGTDDRIDLYSYDAYTSGSYEFAVQASAITGDDRVVTLNDQTPYVNFRYVNASTAAFTVATSPGVTIYASSVDPTRPFHMVGTFKQSGMQYFYMNGALVGEASAPATMNRPASFANRVGCARDNTQYFNGYVDALALYDKQVDGARFAEHYCAAKGYASSTYPYQIITDGASRYWRLASASTNTQYSDIGKQSTLTGANATKINLEQPSLLADSSSLCAYFSATGGSSTSNPGFYQASATDAAVPLRTVEAWFNMSDVSIDRIVLGIYNSNSDRILLRCDGAGDGHLETYSGSISNRTMDSQVPVNASTTYHTVVTYSSSANESTLYMNGVPVDTYAGQVGGLATAARYHIGCGWLSGVNYGSMKGRIDECAAYTSVLTERKIREHRAIGLGYDIDTYPFKVITDGATGYWQLNEANGASDASTVCGLNEGTYNGTVSAGASSIVRHGGTSLRTTAVASSGVKIGDYDFFDKTGNHSFELWYETTASATDQTLISKELAGTNYPEYKISTKSNGHVKYVLGSANTSGGRHTCSTTASYNDGTPHHVVCRHDNTANYMQVFVDAQQDASTTFNGNVWNSSDDATIGYNAGSPQQSYAGKISDVAIYATALSSATIREHYDRGRPVA